MPFWKKAKNIVHTTPTYLKQSMSKKIPVVIIDLRDASLAKISHIKGAISIPAGQLINYQAKFPKIKSAPIVLYAENTAIAERAFKVVRGWGYGKTAILKGNFNGWVQAKGPVSKGSLTSEVVYIPKPVPGEINAKRFTAIASKLPSDVFILDARDVDETTTGMLKGAVNIPTQDIIYRLNEIPKNKKIIIHCKTGTRASVAYETLKQNGYKVEFLNKKIKIGADGNFDIGS